MKNILKYHEIAPTNLSGLGTSEKGQDSLIQYTFEQLGVTNKYYVEFGACDGIQACNTFYLRKYEGWTGLLLEGHPACIENSQINLHRRWITRDNICQLFREFAVPTEPDFLCIDIDGFDYWVMQALLEGGYFPRVVMIETNVRFEPYQSMTLKYHPHWFWDDKKWYGASPYALKKLFNSHGYIPVWINMDDLIAIRKDVLDSHGYEEPDWSYVYPKSNAALYRGYNAACDPREWQEV